MALRCQLYGHKSPMHLVDLIFGSFKLKDLCMDVKFMTLRVISTLGGQIYTLDAMSSTEIDCMDMEFGGLAEFCS